MSTQTSLEDLHHWPDPAGGHSVQLYEDEDFLIDALSRFAGSALGAGDPVIVLATESHRQQLAARLFSNSINLETAMQQGRYVSFDAEETLARFMSGGRPHRLRFMTEVGGLIAQTVAAASPSGRYVAAFGEMVALLWAEGNREGALELEQLWNELAQAYRFYLHCAYPSALFVGAGDAEPLASVCAQHSHAVYGSDDLMAVGVEDHPQFQAVAIARAEAHQISEHLRHNSRSAWA